MTLTAELKPHSVPQKFYKGSYIRDATQKREWFVIEPLQGFDNLFFRRGFTKSGKMHLEGEGYIFQSSHDMNKYIKRWKLDELAEKPIWLEINPETGETINIQQKLF